MGFFASRKAEPSPLPVSERASVKVIRSRFYGKAKSVGRASPAPSASPPVLPTTLPLPPRPSEPHASSQSPSSTGRQVSADGLTMSLAQRLNDLAIANADGLLDDDEYRLLRQNIFERFATSDSPTDTPVVPLPSSSNGSSTREQPQRLTRSPSISSQRSISTTFSALFRRASGRAPTSPTLSPSGSVFSLQQRMSPTADSASVLSGHSRPSISSSAPLSTNVPRGVSRRPSDESLMSSSHAGSVSGSLTADLRGIVSRRNNVGSGSTNYASSVSSRATTRVTKPPSAFNLRYPALRQRTHEDDEDGDHPKSAAELREEIENVESEGRKLLDAFNGLELSALTKPRSISHAVPLSAPPEGTPRRLSIYPESSSSSTLGSSYTLVPERAGSIRVKPGHGQPNHVPLVRQPVSLKRKPSVVDSIASSFKSSASDLRGNFLASAPSSLHGTRSSPNLHDSNPATPTLPPSASVPGAAPKKRPPSSRRNIGSPNMLHPVPVTRPSPLTHRTNPTADPTLHALEVELADIRRRRADVSARYERRLEFLRAKLKAAEIRERLSKK